MKQFNSLFLLYAISLAFAFTACSSSDDSDDKTPQPVDLTPAGVVAVDLGLPSGTKWANMNVGASKPEDYGLFFAWGETKGYSSSILDKEFNESENVYIAYTDRSFDWATYKFSPDNWIQPNRRPLNFKKYNNYGDILEAEDDVATANWSSKWRMPTHAEWQELARNCYWEWATSYNGVAGFIVYEAKNAAHKGKMKDSSGTVCDMSTWDVDTSFSGSYTTNDTHIFLPAAGYRRDTRLYGHDSYCGYWSCELHTTDVYYAWFLYSYDGYVLADGDKFGREFGQSVRPVQAQ